MIEMLSETYPISLACAVLDCARSSYHYRPTETDVTGLKAAIEMLVSEWPTYGYRRITAQLHRTDVVVNHKRVSRLMAEMGLHVKTKRKHHPTTDGQHDFPRYPNLVQGLEIVRPDQAWVSDITYVRLEHEFVYLAVIMDVFTRCIRGWHLSRSLDHSLTLLALRHSLKHHTPEIHHSDQGIQYAATAYTQLLLEVGAQISMAKVGEAWQNGYAERLMRTIKEEEIDLSDYEDYFDALCRLGHFLDEVYIHKRIHSSLGYLTPAEFESQWLREHSNRVAET
jgi:putative transposase